jgi:hypothetical protein
MGTDGTKTVTITHNDADYGCLLFGNAELLQGYRIVLVWDQALLRYIEDRRNF